MVADRSAEVAAAAHRGVEASAPEHGREEDTGHGEDIGLEGDNVLPEEGEAADSIHLEEGEVGDLEDTGEDIDQVVDQKEEDNGRSPEEGEALYQGISTSFISLELSARLTAIGRLPTVPMIRHAAVDAAAVDAAAGACLKGC